MKIVPKMHSKWILLGAVFRKWKKIEKCVSTAQARTDCIWAHTVERPGRPKFTQKNKLIPGTLFFQEKSENIQKLTPKRSPNEWLYFSLTFLWRPLGHHWCPSPFSNTKNEPKALPKCHWSWKVLQKVTQKDPKSSKNDFKSANTFRDQALAQDVSDHWLCAIVFCIFFLKNNAFFTRPGGVLGRPWTKLKVLRVISNTLNPKKTWIWEFFDVWESQSGPCYVQIDPYGILEHPGAPKTF